ncbi:hypothetical protein NQ314_009358 [Rhamnusium bicolor]|uniref:PiggyBac transposable element-derived protein domain-containing protein n=1 Tax=Rhamnusium bicolor TaxID=1586634 RepID=A0AAV8Y1J0_9CUCU|nr:hypothetical protein NQ314_009358 [Rhamnusium bicolor]
MPAKPHKWGYKLFVLCGASGFSYNFAVYSGSENQPKFRSVDEPDLGASSNTVVRLCRAIPRTSWEYVCNFDGVKVTSVAWKDNKNVCLMSTSAGELSEGSVKHFDKKEKKFLYRRVAVQKNQTKILRLAEFRAEIADCLCRIGTERTSKRGRPSDVETKIAQKKKRSITTSYIPN